MWINKSKKYQRNKKAITESKMSSAKQMNTIVTMLSSKYGFDAEEGLKYVETNAAPYVYYDEYGMAAGLNGFNKMYLVGKMPSLI